MNKFNNIPPDIKSLNHVMCKNTPVLKENLLPYYSFIQNLHHKFSTTIKKHA